MSRNPARLMSNKVGEEGEGEADEEDNKLAYKDMPDSHYYASTILGLTAICTIASTLKSVYLMLDFVGVVGVIFISFIQPGAFYIHSWAKYQKDKNLHLK